MFDEETWDVRDAYEVALGLLVSVWDFNFLGCTYVGCKITPIYMYTHDHMGVCIFQPGPGPGPAGMEWLYLLIYYYYCISMLLGMHHLHLSCNILFPMKNSTPYQRNVFLFLSLLFLVLLVFYLLKIIYFHSMSLLVRLKASHTN